MINKLLIPKSVSTKQTIHQQQYGTNVHLETSTLGLVLDTKIEKNGGFNLIIFFLNCYILIQISLDIVPKGNTSALVETMAWHQWGDKPFSEPIIAYMHICITRPQWINTLRPEQNGWHFTNYFSISIIIYISLYFCNLIHSLKFVPPQPMDST